MPATLRDPRSKMISDDDGLSLSKQHCHAIAAAAISAAGIMGQGMASNLAKAGAKVVVWNRSEGKRSAFVAEHEGCSAVATPKEVVEACELTYLMLSDLEASK